MIPHVGNSPQRTQSHCSIVYTPYATRQRWQRATHFLFKKRSCPIKRMDWESRNCLIHSFVMCYSYMLIFKKIQNKYAYCSLASFSSLANNVIHLV